MKIQNTFKANVIWGSLGFSLAIIAALLFDTQQTISYLAAAKAFKVADKVSYISTGGGAFLEFLEGKTLPAIAALQERTK